MNKKIDGCHNSQSEYYDKNIYEEIKNENNYIREKYFEVHKEVLRMADLKDGENLLDIGIGTGLLEERIEAKVIIHGIDISDKMTEKIKEKKLNVEIKEGSFTEIPYPAKTFSVILSCFAFHHLTDNEKEASVKEMKRTLKSNGRIVIGDLMYLNKAGEEKLREKFKSERRYDVIEDMDEENFTNIEWFKNKLRTNNFKVEYNQISTLSWVLKATLE